MTDLLQHIIQTRFPESSQSLYVGRYQVSRIVEKVGSPLFLYNGQTFQEKFHALRQTFPDPFTIYYSVKANPNPTIIQRFVDLGCGLEVASKGELYFCLNSGGKPHKIIFAGPGKNDEEIEFALQNRIKEIHAESLTELDRINTIGKNLGITVPVSIRVNPTGEVQGGAMRMGGKPVQFGIDEEQLPVVFDLLADCTHVEAQGLHLFAGTQILDFNVLLGQYEKGLELGRQFSKWFQRPIRTLDFGGGLGIPYFVHEKELDLSSLKIGLKDLMDKIGNDSCFSETSFILEPGRYLVGDSGIYLSRIVDIKKSRGKTFVILDGGMNHHLSASGNLGQVIKRNFPMTLVDKLHKEPSDVYDVVGPLCTPLDTLGRDVKLPKAEIGDVLGIFQSGAYARSASPMCFLGHPTPPEVLIDQDAAFMIRRGGTYKNLVEDCVLEPMSLKS